MLSQWMVVVIAFFTSAFLSSFLFSKLVFFKVFRDNNFSAAASVILSCVISSAVFLTFYWNQNDFIENVSVWSFLTPAIGLAIMFLACLLGSKIAINISVFLAVVIGVFGGDLFIEFVPDASEWLNKLYSVLVWTLFSIGIRCVAMIYPVLQIQGITLAAGVVVLYFFGVMPFMITIVGATFLAAMMVAYLNYLNQTIGVMVSSVIGYLMGWFVFVTYNEMLLPCLLILLMVCLIEISICLIKKFTFLSKYRLFLNNSSLMQIYNSGFPQDGIIKSLWMLSAIVIVFSIFQANGVNSYSIPIFVFVVVSWHFYKMLSWKNKEKTWKEMKNEVVDDVKGTINQIVDRSKKQKRINVEKENKLSVKNSKINKSKNSKTKTAKTKKVKKKADSKIEKGQK